MEIEKHERRCVADRTNWFLPEPEFSVKANIPKLESNVNITSAK